MKTLVLVSLFNFQYCEIFNSTYFEEHLRTVASANMLMKLKKQARRNWEEAGGLQPPAPPPAPDF